MEAVNSEDKSELTTVIESAVQGANIVNILYFSSSSRWYRVRIVLHIITAYPCTFRILSFYSLNLCS